MDDAFLAVKHVAFRLHSESRQGLESSLDIFNELIPFGEVSFQLISQYAFAEDLLQDICLFAIVTHPLFAALACYFDQSGIGTAQVRQGELLRAQWNTSHRPIDACALVFTVGLEAFSVLVDPAVVLTGSAL